jgi:carbonic anhydrase/acetyltransferase-like protein (isoleucine patch superfamily)
VVCYTLEDLVPDISASAYVAESATVVGRVILEAQASVWFGAVIRGDDEVIAVGEDSNVQDLAVLHADPGFPVVIGRGVTVGHRAMLHGCKVADGALIGIGAVVLNGASVGEECLVGAGALVTQGASFPRGSLVLGAPARVVRPLTTQEVEGLRENAAHYVARGSFYRRALNKV